MATVPPDPTSTPTLSAADVWQATLVRLDSVWQTDWPASIEILDSYLQQYPDHSRRQDKLYAALVGYGGTSSNPEARTTELRNSNGRRLSHPIVRKPRTPCSHSPRFL